jgi:6-phosphogluconate dehydrogenase
MQGAQGGWRRTIAQAALMGIPTPAMSSALASCHGYRRERLPANVLQAQRDYFGAHIYERVDKPRGEFFHTNWTGRGGNVSSRSYNVWRPLFFGGTHRPRRRLPLCHCSSF